MAKVEEWPEVAEPEPMGREEFEAALFALGSSYGAMEPFPLKRLAPAVGRSPRQLSRYRHEEGEVDPPVAKLVRLFVAHGEVF